MAINSLYPSFVQIHYHSKWGPHVQTIPTRQWAGPSGGHPNGTYTSWAGAAVDAETMINAFVDKLAVIGDALTVWDTAIIFNYPAPLPASPQPVSLFPLTQHGAITHSDLTLAIENVYVFFDSAFNTFKMYTLDMDDSFNLQAAYPSSLDANHVAIVTELEATTNAWASRAGLKPSVLRKVISKPNDKLRKIYRLT